ncbi:IclR family transcriptional regulator [Bifidobacterium callitrichos]|nr:helix-turn-helix domain-containing protein [Bifidobacterium callitrichos]
MRDKASNEERGVEVLVKTRAVLDALARLGPSNIKTISAHVGEPTSSMYRLLANLVALGWVEPAVKRGEYRLGLACLRIGGQIESRLEVQDVAHNAFRRYRDPMGTWSLFVRRGTRDVCIEMRRAVHNPLRAPLPGYSLPVDSDAAPSQALLSFLVDDQFDDVVEHCRYAADSAGRQATFPHAAAMTRERVRGSGYAYDFGVTVPGVVTLCAPVFDHRGELSAAICLSGYPRELARAIERGELVDQVGKLRYVSREISKGLGHAPEDAQGDVGVGDLAEHNHEAVSAAAMQRRGETGKE